MGIQFVDLKAQYEGIKGEIDAAVAGVIGKTAFIGGPGLAAFEKEFAAFCGRRHCVGVGNGTDAIYIALRAMGIGAGDEVIVPANSFIATSEAVTLTGARVVFCDVDHRTLNVDPALLAGKVTPRTRAIIPVHLYGQPADMDPILALAKKHGLRVLEDAAQGHAGLYKGRKVGALGDAACFSFYPGKNLGAYGDGGAIVTDDDALALKARMIANHGRVDKYDHEIEGVNSRLDGLQAAVLSVKLRHLPEWTESRRRNAYLYNRLLAGAPLKTPEELPEVKAVYHLYVVRVAPGARQKVQDHLKSKGIATGIHYPIALPELKAYAYLGHKPSDFPVASRASQEILSLPMFPELREEEIGEVCKAVRESL